MSIPVWAPLPLVGTWLGACLVYDLRIRQVPNLLTFLPLGLALVWRTSQGGWWVAGLAVFLVLISDLRWENGRISLGVLGCAILALIVGPSLALNLAAICAVWVLWELSGMGGADAKILWILLLLTGDARLLFWVLLAGGLQGLVALLINRKSVPYMVAIVLGTLIWFLVSSG